MLRPDRPEPEPLFDEDDLFDEIPAGTRAQWAQDDRDAEAFASTRQSPWRRVRRLSGGVTAFACVFGFAVIVVGAVLQELGDGEALPSDLNNLLVAGVLVAGGIGIAGFLLYAAARRAHLEHAQGVAFAWLERRGPDQAERGLPPLLLEAFAVAPPADHLKGTAGFSAGVVSMGALIAAPVLYVDDLVVPVAAVLGVVAGGVVAGVVSVAFYVAVSRDRRRQTDLADRLSGSRRGLRAGPSEDGRLDGGFRL